MRSPSSFALGVGLLLLGVTEAAAQPSAHVAYFGGRVVSNPQVIAVDWGPDVDSQVANGMPGFYATILESPYLDWLSEYSTVGQLSVTDADAGSNQRIGRGSFVDSVTITPSLAGTALTNAQVLAELQTQIAAGHLPPPVSDALGNANTVYMVNFPPGVSLTSTYGVGGSCLPPDQSGFCGFADTMTVGTQSVGVGLIPDQSPASPCTGLCGADPSYFNNATEVHAHVLLNLVTNLEFGLWNQEASGTIQRPVAWYDVGGSEHQVADLCNLQPADVQGYTVEMGWSNLQAACVFAPASPLPVCTTGTTYCRQCNSTDVGQDGGCTGTTALCETAASNASFGECVQCTADGTSCSGTTPICGTGGTENDTCRACIGDAECTTNAAGPHCLTSGACGAEPTTGAASSGCSSTANSAGTLGTLCLLWVLLLRRRAPVPRGGPVSARARDTVRHPSITPRLPPGA